MQCPIVILICAILMVPSPSFAWSGVVTQIVDGDTITVVPAGQTDAPIRVRLYGVDAPEQRQEYGPEATAALKAMLPVGATADIIPMDTDRYGRTVGLLIVEGKTVNLDMVRGGHAWVVPKYCKAYFCRRWMGDAKKAKRQQIGLWGFSSPESPWTWRQAYPSDHQPSGHK